MYNEQDFLKWQWALVMRFVMGNHLLFTQVSRASMSNNMQHSCLKQIKYVYIYKKKNY